MQLQGFGHLGLNLLEEAKELLEAMAFVAAPDHPAGGNVQRGKQRGRAMPVIIVGASFGLPRTHQHFAVSGKLRGPSQPFPELGVIFFLMESG